MARRRISTRWQQLARPSYVPRRTLHLLAAVLLLTVLAAPAQAYQRYEPHPLPTDFTFSPGAGRASGRSVVLWSTGAASAYLDTTEAVGQLTFSATARICEGAPHLQVAVDGVTKLTQEVDGSGYYGVTIDWPPGRHKITFRFLDDHRTPSCDRNVLVSNIWLWGPRADGTHEPLFSFSMLKPQFVTVEPATAGNTTMDRAKLWNNGVLRFRLDSLFGTHMYVGLVGAGCGGHLAHVVLRMDGEIVYDDEAVQGFHAIEIVRSFPDGPHDFLLTMSRDPNTATCDGNVSVIGAQFQGMSE